MLVVPRYIQEFLFSIKISPFCKEGLKMVESEGSFLGS